MTTDPMSLPAPVRFALPPATDWRTLPGGSRLLAAAIMVALAVGCGFLLRAELSPSSIPMLFLVAVLVASLRFGFWTGIFASILAFLAENFFFIEPYFTFHVTHVADWLTLVVLLAAGATTGFLVGRLSEEAEASRNRAFALEVMSQSASDLADCTTRGAALQTLVRHLARLEGGATVALAAQGEALAILASYPADLVLEAVDAATAERCLRRGSEAEPAAPGWAGGRFAFRPLRGVGVVGHTLTGHDGAAEKQRREAREALIEQAALTLERLKLAQDAAQARESAEREALRSALLSSLSHDLKTPLATILGGVSSLRELGQAMPKQARADTLEAVEEEARRLSRYVANLLHMTRLKAGLELHADWIDPTDVAHAALSRARRAWPARALVLEAGADLPIIRSDSVLLEQALFNLIDNACKFSPEAERVLVHLDPKEDGISFSVQDRGPGIPAAEQAHVFDPFFRGEGRTQSGSGLGLAIVRGIVQALGGTAELESPSGGQPGTTMRLHLPRDIVP